MSWLQIVINFFGNELQALIRAPFAFGVLLLLGFLGSRWLYGERLSNLREQVQEKNEQIEDLKTRLGLSNPQLSLYASYTSRELRQKALSFSTRLRDFSQNFEVQINEIIAEYDIQFQSQYQKLRRENPTRFDEYMSTRMSHLAQQTRIFEHEFKVEAILIKNELAARLPRGAIDNRRHIDELYRLLEETNTLGMTGPEFINSIASAIESLARNLQVKSRSFNKT